jgi:prophage antirepressor-like protein
MTKELTIYFNDQPTRVETINGVNYVVALDAIRVLGLNNITWALKRVPKQHLCQTKVLSPDCRMRDHWLVDEAGLNYLVLESNKPDAKAYKEKICAVILPSIRKTGAYSVNPSSLEQAMAALANTFNAFMSSTTARLDKLEGTQPVQPTKLLPQVTLTKKAQFRMKAIELHKGGLDWRDCYGQPYRMLYYTKGINLKERARNAGLRPIDVAEKLNCFDDLIAICDDMLVRK